MPSPSVYSAEMKDDVQPFLLSLLLRVLSIRSDNTKKLFPGSNDPLVF